MWCLVFRFTVRSSSLSLAHFSKQMEFLAGMGQKGRIHCEMFFPTKYFVFPMNTLTFLSTMLPQLECTDTIWIRSKGMNLINFMGHISFIKIAPWLFIFHAFQNVQDVGRSVHSCSGSSICRDMVIYSTLVFLTSTLCNPRLKRTCICKFFI